MKEYPNQFTPQIVESERQVPVTMEDWALIRNLTDGLFLWQNSKHVIDFAMIRASVNSKDLLPNRPE